MPSGIILIGPICVGKSTLAALLAARLALPRIEVDELRWHYFEQTAYSKDEARRIHAAEGNLGVLRYSKPFEAQMVAAILRDHPDAVIDFGAGHSVYDDPADFARVQAALAPFERVVLVLPCADPDEAIAILNARFRALLEREGVEPSDEYMQMNADFVRSPCNAQLAKLTVYTEGKTAEQTCAEIITALSLRGHEAA
jgi:shikimate kinase